MNYKKNILKKNRGIEIFFIKSIKCNKCSINV